MEHQEFNELFRFAESKNIRVYAVTEFEKLRSLLQSEYDQERLDFNTYNSRHNELVNRFCPNANPILFLCIDYGNRREFGRMAFKDQVSETGSTLNEQLCVLLKAVVEKEINNKA